MSHMSNASRSSKDKDESESRRKDRPWFKDGHDIMYAAPA